MLGPYTGSSLAKVCRDTSRVLSASASRADTRSRKRRGQYMLMTCRSFEARPLASASFMDCSSTTSLKCAAPSLHRFDAVVLLPTDEVYQDPSTEPGQCRKAVNSHCFSYGARELHPSLHEKLSFLRPSNGRGRSVSMMGGETLVDLCLLS